MWIGRKRPGVLAGALLLAAFALSGCGGASADRASLRAPMSGCADAVAARAEALAAIDQATERAIAQNEARAAELRALGEQGPKEIAAAVDLAPCDDEDPATGVVIDLADLRVRYGIVRERTQQRLDETAAQPPPADTKDDDTKGKRGKGGGTKGD